MTELELLVDFHKDAERQGPGSPEDTLRALEFIQTHGQHQKILDIGCGTGAQSFDLARNTDGSIIALDLFPEFLSELEARSERLGLSHRIRSMEGSMDKLPFSEEEFDIIWSEGAIYNMGFENGVQYWSNFLKPGGYMAISEVTWTSNTRPSEIEEFWARSYPEIGTAGDKIRIMESNGFSLSGYFVLPETSWLDEYYNPMEERFSDFLVRHDHSTSATAVVQEHRSEIELYQKFKDYYSYGFFIARKI